MPVPGPAAPHDLATTTRQDDHLHAGFLSHMQTEEPGTEGEQGREANIRGLLERL